MLPINYVPSNTEVQFYHQKWHTLLNYIVQDNALQKCFAQFPTNTSFEDVLIKCTLLNKYYSAGVLDKHMIDLAHFITKLNIDSKLVAGDYSIVDSIKKCPNVRNYYSFATKYCNWHNKDTYAIYDRYVVKVLCELKKRNMLNSFSKNNELDNYCTFRNALIELVTKFNLTNVMCSNKYGVNFKMLDRYLWLLGKQYF